MAVEEDAAPAGGEHDACARFERVQPTRVVFLGQRVLEPAGRDAPDRPITEHHGQRHGGLLQAGDKVIGNNFTEIKSVERVTTSIDVFNLSVYGTRTFYVTDETDVYLVHNK